MIRELFLWLFRRRRLTPSLPLSLNAPVEVGDLPFKTTADAFEYALRYMGWSDDESEEGRVALVLGSVPDGVTLLLLTGSPSGVLRALGAPLGDHEIVRPGELVVWHRMPTPPGEMPLPFPVGVVSAVLHPVLSRTGWRRARRLGSSLCGSAL